jgi:hypothetical protein
MRGGWRRIGMMALGILALLGGAGAGRSAPARAQEPRPESGCRTPGLSDFGCKIERKDERGASGREARWCAGVYWVVGLSDRTDARDPAACYGVLTGLDCSGHIVRSPTASAKAPTSAPPPTSPGKPTAWRPPPWAPASGTAPAPAPGGTTTARPSA